MTLENCRYFATVAKVAFDSEEHNVPSLGIGPSIDFFKLLVRSQLVISVLFVTHTSFQTPSHTHQVRPK